MNFLSQIQVEKDEAAKQSLRDCYDWHQAIWRAFPGNNGQSRSFLFRVDDQHECFRILLLSPQRPVVPAWGAWRTKEIAPSFLSYERYLFQLRANPTIKKTVLDEDLSKKKNGRRVGIYDDATLLRWLERKAALSGFEIIECTIGPILPHYFVKGGQRGKLNAVDFQGVLQVKDRTPFTQAFYQGIGSAKTFGFGLLMLQPAL